MSGDRLQEILRTEPPQSEVALRAARARQRALAGFHAAPGVPGAWWTAFWTMPMRSAAALVMVLAGAGLLAFRQLPEATVLSEAQPHKAAPAAARLEMNFQLSDGTKVRWVFNENFAL